MTGGSHANDGFAWAGSPLARIDPRVKIAGVAGLLLINLVTHSFIVPGMIAASMLLLMVAGSIPYRRQLVMISFPASFALMAVISQTVFEGGSVIAKLGPFDLHGDGMMHGLLISLRVVAGGLIVVVLGVTTPLSRLCLALRWFRVPAAFVEVVQMTYRYLFDIHAEFSRMKDAQRARLGWSSARSGLVSSRMLGGALFMRVYDRGLRSSEAMRCRGSGALITGSLPRLRRIDFIAGAVILILLLTLGLISLFEALS